MANLKRLILKRFGGTSNFILFVLMSLTVYLLLKNYYFMDDEEDINRDPRVADGIKQPDQPKVQPPKGRFYLFF